MPRGTPSGWQPGRDGPANTETKRRSLPLCLRTGRSLARQPWVASATYYAAPRWLRRACHVLPTAARSGLRYRGRADAVADLDAALDFAYDGSSNVVDQYVTYLRKKVDVPFGRHDLETVRGWVTGCAKPNRSEGSRALTAWLDADIAGDTACE